MSRHPYALQPPQAFWNTGVSNSHPLSLKNIYKKKFDIGGLSIASAGSCFAQHIGRVLKANGFNFMDVEPPIPSISPELQLAYGFSMYSARYGNIYTARQLVQLLRESLGEFNPKERFWEKDGGFVDPFRPTIEPRPFSTVDELIAMRSFHLQKVKTLFSTCELFIFTLGLTETWENIADGAVYPVVPGTRSGGTFDAAKYRFKNFTYMETMQDMEDFYSLLRKINPACKLMLTVSPVPLMATATDEHVMSATMYSKSVLRAVAGDFASKYDTVDYFPSYEIISSPATKGMFFMGDSRSVASAGVEYVMKHFLSEHIPPKIKSANPDSEQSAAEQAMDVLCDEEVLATLNLARE